MHILLAEDHVAIAAQLARGLEHEGYTVTVLTRGDAVLAGVQKEHPNLLILDLGLPGADGLTVTRALRAAGHTLPVLHLTARDTRADVLAGFAAGADDYLVKPFDFAVLLARLQALLRRLPIPSDSIICGQLRLNVATRTAEYADTTIFLTPRECDLLACLARAAGRVVSRTEILQEVWGETASQTALEVHVSSLRRKFVVAAPGLIVTVKGHGYQLNF